MHEMAHLHGMASMSFIFLNISILSIFNILHTFVFIVDISWISVHIL